MRTLHIIEDNEVYLKFLETALKKDYNVQGFKSAEDFLSVAEKAMPNVIISDYYLPGINGFDLLQQLKKQMQTDTKFVLLSANKNGPLVLDLIRRGLRNYVMKDENVLRNIRATINDETYQY